MPSLPIKTKPWNDILQKDSEFSFDFKALAKSVKTNSILYGSKSDQLAVDQFNDGDDKMLASSVVLPSSITGLLSIVAVLISLIAIYRIHKLSIALLALTGNNIQLVDGFLVITNGTFAMSHLQEIIQDPDLSHVINYDQSNLCTIDNGRLALILISILVTLSIYLLGKNIWKTIISSRKNSKLDVELLLEVRNHTQACLIVIGKFHYSAFYKLHSLLQTPKTINFHPTSCLSIRSQIQLEWVNKSLIDKELVLPDRVSVSFWEHRKLKNITSKPYMANFFVKHHGLMSIVVLSSSSREMQLESNSSPNVNDGFQSDPV